MAPLPHSQGRSPRASRKGAKREAVDITDNAKKIKLLSSMRGAPDIKEEEKRKRHGAKRKAIEEHPDGLLKHAKFELSKGLPTEAMRLRIRRKESEAREAPTTEDRGAECRGTKGGEIRSSLPTLQRKCHQASACSNSVGPTCTRESMVRNLERRIDDNLRQAKMRRIETDNSESIKVEEGSTLVHGVRYVTR